MRKGFLLRDEQWAYIQYNEDASNGIELFDMNKDPKQYTNLAKDPKHAEVVARFQSRLETKLKDVRKNDLTIKAQ